MRLERGRCDQCGIGKLQNWLKEEQQPRRIWNTKTGGGMDEHLSRRLAVFYLLFTH